jgi:transposase
VLPVLTTVALDHSCLMIVSHALSTCSVKDMEVLLELLAVMDGTVLEVKRSQNPLERFVLSAFSVSVVMPNLAVRVHIKTKLVKQDACLALQGTNVDILTTDLPLTLVTVPQELLSKLLA